jgi:uncharacterized metal-binding protein
VRFRHLIPLAWMSLAVTGWATAAGAAGNSPADPIVFNPNGGSIPINVPSAGAWLRANPVPATTRTHFEVQTTGTLDTVISVYATLADAVADLPFAEDDDSGAGYNALLRIPIGFVGPYLIRVQPYFSGGTTTISSQFVAQEAVRCNWPAGCPLAEIASARESGSFLTTLRRVRDEILERSDIGRELSSLYWRIAPDLMLPALVDSEFREQVYSQTAELLPLAEDALLLVNAGTKANLIDRSLRAEELAQLLRLKDLITSRLTPEHRIELDGYWERFGLDGAESESLLKLLRRSGLLTGSALPLRVVFKLRTEPNFDAIQQKLGTARVDALIANLSEATLSRVFSDLPTNRAQGLSRVFVLEAKEPLELLFRVRNLPEIEWAELDGKVYALANTADPYAAGLWGLDMVGAPAAWSTTQGSCAVPVAIVDTGLRADLLDFAGRVLTARGYDFADDDPDPVDRHGHGTHVAGTIAAAINNSVSVAGVAPGVCIFGVKALSDSGSGDATGVAASIVHAANQGAKVINLSLGSDDFFQVIEDALVFAASKDAVIIAAAGNDGREGLSYPASSTYVVAVGAIEADRTLASFSNFGAGLDLVAPGVDIISNFSDGESCMGSGTSMAAPHAAGVAALVRTAHPTLNRTAVMNRLISTAQNLGPPGWDVHFGNGLVDASRAVGQAATCTNALCLVGQRFVARISWRDAQGNSGSASLAPIRSDSSGLFWFFSPSNWEVLVKVLDGCALNGNFWVFSAATTNVEYTLEVVDTRTGTTKRYTNPLGVTASAVTDTAAFPTCSHQTLAESIEGNESPVAKVYPERSMTGLEMDLVSQEALVGSNGTGSAEDRSAGQSTLAACNPISEVCLNGNRFKVEVRWRDFLNQTGVARAVPGGTTSDSALLWFFDGANWEMLVKVLDGCPLNGRRWVFSAATTNVEYTLKITDTQTGAVKEYFNPLGRSAPAIADTSAFASCSP